MFQMPRIGGGVSSEWLSLNNTLNDGDNPARDSLRALLLLFLFGITFFMVMLSTIFRSRLATSHRLIAVLSCLGAGVFLSACLLDLLPDVYEHFEHASISSPFPFAEASIAAGFLMVLTLEQVAVMYQESRGLGHSHGHHRRLSGEDGEDEEESGPSMETLPSVLLVLSLSLHAFFEGLSLAVIPDAAKLIQVFAALVIHKSLIGLSLGVRLVEARLRPLIVALCALLFSIQVLVGGLAGLWILHLFSGPVGQIVSASLQGIACGTFLFITTMEALPHELGPGAEWRGLRLGSVFLGVALIATFIIVFPEAA